MVEFPQAQRSWALSSPARRGERWSALGVDNSVDRGKLKRNKACRVGPWSQESLPALSERKTNRWVSGGQELLPKSPRWGGGAGRHLSSDHLSGEAGRSPPSPRPGG